MCGSLNCCSHPYMVLHPLQPWSDPIHGRLAELQTCPSTGATLLHVIVVYIVMR